MSFDRVVADIKPMKEKRKVSFLLPQAMEISQTNSSKYSDKAEGNKPVLGCVMPLTLIKGYDNYPKTRNLM